MRLPSLYLVLLVAMAPAHVSGQQALQAITALVSQGRSEQARQALIQWWDEEWPGASRRDKQRGLWMRARLTVDPAFAELDYQRLVVEFPGGSYSDQALYRLAQSSEARGDAPGAARHFGAVVKDYPASRHTAAALAWLGQNPAAVASLLEAEVAAAEEVAAVEEPVAAEQATMESGGYAVQLGAFSDGTGARRIADLATARGFGARMVRVPGNELIRVRVGRFENQEDALELMRRVKAGGFEVALVTDAAQEDPIS